MKKIQWGIALLFLVAPCLLLADTPPAPGKNPPAWVVEHQKNHGKGKNAKLAKPPRTVSGTAQKGAPQVSFKGKKKTK